MKLGQETNQIWTQEAGTQDRGLTGGGGIRNILRKMTAGI